MEAQSLKLREDCQESPLSQVLNLAGMEIREQVKPEPLLALLLLNHLGSPTTHPHLGAIFRARSWAFIVDPQASKPP